jgi:hypothetical protein
MQSQSFPKIATRSAVLEPWQQALSDARQVAKMALGDAASSVVAERHGDNYRGMIIGHTHDYIIQQIGRQAAAVIHSKDLFHTPDRGFPWPEVGRTYVIRYSRSQAIVREIRERLREQEVSR